MIALSPDERPTFDALLRSSRRSIFPECFYAPIYDVVTSVSDVSPLSPFARSTVSNAKPTISDPRLKPEAEEKESRNITLRPSALPTDSDRQVQKISSEFGALCLSFESDVTTGVSMQDAPRYDCRLANFI